MAWHDHLDRRDWREMFPLPLKITAIDPFEALKLKLPMDRTHWRYLSDFICRTRFGKITSHAGEVTDFASIPSFALSYLDDDDPRILWAACAHDKAWSTGRTDLGNVLTLKEVNAILTDAMKVCGASWSQRALVGAAVAAYGRLKKWKPS